MLNPLRQLRTWVSILVATLLVTATAAADPVAAQRFVRDRQTQLSNLVRKGADAEVDRVFADTFDYDTIARDSLGDAWGGLTAAQQEQFRCVLRQLIARAYHRDLRRTLDYTITFEGSEAAERGVLVKTVAKNKANQRDEPVSIAYVVHRTGDAWRIRDIVTEGSSLVANYESQFRKLLKRKGYEEMIRKMKERLGPDGASCG